MALKRQNSMMSAFSMASMTDIVFLLLIFFMVTSTYVFPTALEVNLPQSTEQTVLKPGIRIYIDADARLSTVVGDGKPEPMDLQSLPTWLKLAVDQIKTEENPNPCVALYADEAIPYGKVIEVLNIGAADNVKMVLATKPTATTPTAASTPNESENENG